MIKRQLKRPRLISPAEKEPTLSEAVRDVAGLIPKSTAFFVGLTGFAYYSGWRQSDAYYASLGAPWIASSLSPFSLVVLSAGLLTMNAIAAVAALVHIGRVRNGVKQIGWGSVAVFMLGAVCAFAKGFLPARWATPSVIWQFEQAHVLLTAISAGLMIGLAISTYQKAKLEWSGRAFYWIYMALLYGLYQAPYDLGSARARYHLAPACDALPFVSIGSETTGKWRLVEVIGQNAFLMAQPASGVVPAFRIVDTKNIASIRRSALD